MAHQPGCPPHPQASRSLREGVLQAVDRKVPVHAQRLGSQHCAAQSARFPAQGQDQKEQSASHPHQLTGTWSLGSTWLAAAWQSPLGS